MFFWSYDRSTRSVINVVSTISLVDEVNQILELNLRCISMVTDAETGWLILLLDAWQINTAWRSALESCFTIKVFLRRDGNSPGSSVESRSISPRHHFTFGSGRPEKQRTYVKYIEMKRLKRSRLILFNSRALYTRERETTRFVILIG